MSIVCISASNIKNINQRSNSLKTCYLLKDIMEHKYTTITDIEIIQLVNYELKPCIGCGACFWQQKCIHDNAFNEIYDMLIKSDAIFIVSPHYAPIPSKLSMLLEKIDQLTFLKKFNNENYKSPLYKKPVGIIALGGGSKDVSTYFNEPVIGPISNALSYPVEMNVIGLNADETNGITLPVKKVIRLSNSIFPVQEYDWQAINLKLNLFVNNILINMVHKKRSI